ncbi:MAG: hypothetical protein D6781_00720 [Verrucomicrobia bacterium]|nr:MAG: hypothetical protein D6781_00720 [Verrucomicrobiota bacterium]
MSLCGGLQPGLSSAAPDALPNILMIAVDNLTTGSATSGSITKCPPKIDRLTASGVSFRHTYAPSATCNATRAAP